MHSRECVYIYILLIIGGKDATCGGGCYNEFVILYKDQKIAFVYMYMLLDMCARGLVCTIQVSIQVYPSKHIFFFWCFAGFCERRAKNAKTKWIKLKWIL
jgi:hypothetical protein